MKIKSGLRKLSELTEILLYSQIPPIFWENVNYERRIRLIDKHRNALTNNLYFTEFIEPLVLRLYDHATHSKNVKTYPCAYKGTTFIYTINDMPIYPILTMGSEEQLHKICKKECHICPTAVYSPYGVLAVLIELTMFETARIFSKAKKMTLEQFS